MSIDSGLSCSRTSSTRYASASSMDSGTLNTVSRLEALKRVEQLLQKNQGLLEAYHLIQSFRLEPDDLTEAGVAYEMVRALEKRYPLF